MTIPDVSALQTLLEEARRVTGIPGLSASVCYGEGQVDLVSGVLDCETAEPVLAESVFLVGSVAKPITATLVLQGCAEGRLDLDGAVAAVLGVRIANGAGDGITVRQLLAHTGGLDGDVFEDVGSNDDCLARYAVLVDRFEMMSAPGVLFNYCNAGYALLGRLAEIAFEGVYDDLVEARVFGAADATTRPEAALFRAPARGHAVDAEGRAARTVSPPLSRALGPAGFTLRASARDLAAFAAARFADTAIREPEVTLPDGTAWGLGWKLIMDRGVAFVGHDGGIANQSAALWFAPEHRLAVALCANAPMGKAWSQFAWPVFEAVCGAAPRPPEAVAGEEARPLSRFAGTYRNAGVAIEISEDAGVLNAVATLTGEGHDPIVFSLQPLGNARFRTEIGGDRVVTAFYDFDEDGSPALFHAGRLHRRSDAPG